MIAEQQGDQLPCQIPANNLLYCFLVEARNVRLELPDLDPSADNLTRHMKTAADTLTAHTSRVYDYATALEVKCVGPKLAGVRPPPPPAAADRAVPLETRLSPPSATPPAAHSRRAVQKLPA